MINSQRAVRVFGVSCSISKGMGDQFSAVPVSLDAGVQYIKGDG